MPHPGFSHFYNGSTSIIRPIVVRSTGVQLDPNCSQYATLLRYLINAPACNTVDVGGILTDPQQTEVWWNLMDQLTTTYRAWEPSYDSTILRWITPNTSLALS